MQRILKVHKRTLILTPFRDLSVSVTDLTHNSKPKGLIIKDSGNHSINTVNHSDLLEHLNTVTTPQQTNLLHKTQLITWQTIPDRGLTLHNPFIPSQPIPHSNSKSPKTSPQSHLQKHCIPFSSIKIYWRKECSLAWLVLPISLHRSFVNPLLPWETRFMTPFTRIPTEVRTCRRYFIHSDCP